MAGGACLAPYFPAMAASAGGTVKVLAWEGETFEDQLQGFLKQNNIDLRIASVANQDDVQIQLVGRTPTALDVTSYNEGYADYYGKQLKILSPLDEARLPNYTADSVFEQFYKKPYWYWDGKLYGVVIAWGLNLVVYNPEMVPEVKRYSDLLKPEYKGMLTFVDDLLASWPMIARIAGFGQHYPNLTKDQLDTAFKAIVPYRAQSRLFAGPIGDCINLFVNKEIGAVFCGWAGIPNETTRQGVKTSIAFPEEGGAIWSDAFCIPKTAENRDAAHAYINAVLDPQVQADYAAKNSVATISRKAVALMDKQARGVIDYDDLDGFLAKSPLQGMPPRESDRFATFDQWVEAWEDFKLGF